MNYKTVRVVFGNSEDAQKAQILYNLHGRAGETEGEFWRRVCVDWAEQWFK